MVYTNARSALRTNNSANVLSRRRFSSRTSRNLRSLPPYVRSQLSHVANQAVQRNAELKYFDVNATTTSSTSGVVISLSNVPQGATDITRVGDELKIRSLRVAYTVSQDTSITNFNVYTRCRVVLFQWKLDTSPIALDVMQSTGANVSCETPYDHDARRNYNILYDKVHVFALGASPHQHSEPVCYPTQTKMRFEAGASTLANGALYMLFFSDTTTTLPTMAYYSRLLYTDA